MSPLRFAPLPAIGAAAALITGCASQSAGMVPLSSNVASQTLRLPDATPPSCKGQETKKDYAELTVTLSSKGGSFCVPAIDGFGGSVEYPSANPPVKLQLISSTKNYANLPQLGSGTAIFYLQLAIAGETTFGANVKAGGGLTAKKIVPGKTYTAFGRAVIVGTLYLNFTPCYVKASKGKYGGVIGGVGSLLKNQPVLEATTGFIEIYSGKQASGKC